MNDTSSELTIEWVKRIKLEPGEKLVFNLKGDVTPNGLRELRNGLVNMFGPGTCVIFAGLESLEIIKIEGSE